VCSWQRTNIGVHFKKKTKTINKNEIIVDGWGFFDPQKFLLKEPDPHCHLPKCIEKGSRNLFVAHPRVFAVKCNKVCPNRKDGKSFSFSLV
jgi:hypothetical protein